MRSTGDSPSPDPDLTPAQRDVVELLGTSAAPPVEVDPDLRRELRQELESRLTAVADRLDEPMSLDKRAIEGVHGCEARYLDERDRPFAWTPPLARGVVSHKAIELSVMRRDRPAALTLVDEAMATLAETERGLGDWLRTCGDTVRAEVRNEANRRVGAFLELWPPLRPQWEPQLEHRIEVALCDQRIILRGKPDLTLGRARGQQARKVIVDMKTGGFSPAHTADLRFYALLDTLRVGVPPRIVATYYLDRGETHPEVVTVDVLHAAVDRVIDAAGKLVTLWSGERDPNVAAGPPCRWCRLLDGCDTGRAWHEALDA